MVDSINSAALPESIKPSNQDRKTQVEAQVKDEQENFAKLIEKKALEAQEDKKETKEKPALDKNEVVNQESLKNGEQKAEIAESKKDSGKQALQNTQNATTDKKLSDIKNLAENKQLNPSQIALQQEQEKQENSEAKKVSGNISTQELLEQKSKTEIKKPQQVSEPLAQALREINTKDVEARRKLNQNNKMEYKQEGKSEKIAVIERGKNLPKNIVESKIREEKKEEAFQKVFDKFGVKREGVEDNIMQEALSSVANDKKKTLI